MSQSHPKEIKVFLLVTTWCYPSMTPSVYKSISQLPTLSLTVLGIRFRRKSLGKATFSSLPIKVQLINATQD